MGSIFDQFKKGVQTTEFWFGLAAAVWVVLKTAIDPAKSWSQNVTILAPLLGAAVYAFCRTWLKRGRGEIIQTATTTGLIPPEFPPVDLTADGTTDQKDTAAPPTPVP